MSTAQSAPKYDWQTLDDYKTPMEIAWNFSYDIDIEKLRNLYSKAKKFQWDAEQRLDWSVEVDPSKPIVGEDRFMFHRVPFFQKLSQKQRDTFTAHATAQLLSQFLHGEQGALMTAATLTHAVPDYEAKLYGATQTMDEARHVEVYERYIRKLAIVYPMSPWLKSLIDATLSADKYVKILIGMNMIVEGLALASRGTSPSATSTRARRSTRCTRTTRKTSRSSPSTRSCRWSMRWAAWTGPDRAGRTRAF
jgi:hypothetical protein